MKLSSSRAMQHPMTMSSGLSRLVALWLAVVLVTAPMSAHALAPGADDDHTIYAILSQTCLDLEDTTTGKADPVSQHITCTGCVPGCCASVQAQGSWHRMDVVAWKQRAPTVESTRRDGASHNQHQARSPPDV